MEIKVGTKKIKITDFIRKLRGLCEADIVCLDEKDREYGISWKKRGGIGAFMMLARKWDRIENLVQKHGWNIFEACRKMHSEDNIESTLDDIRDLRRYLLLVEMEVLDRLNGDSEDA